MEIPWVIEEQTKIKHGLLKDYISSWMAILFSTQKNYGFSEILIYIDGFSGPGIYYTDKTKTSTCPGSPIIVADIANKYIEAKTSRKFIIYCIDNDRECVDCLEGHLNSLNKYSQNWQIFCSDFSDKIIEILDEIEKERLDKHPMFIFVDPFGYMEYPIDILKRIMEYPRAEFFINFMIYDLIRFCEVDKLEQKLTKQFGCKEFKKISQCINSEEKQAFLLNLYINKSLIEIANAKFVMPFRVNTPGQGIRPRYYLIHTSNNLKALKVMKDKMAKASESEYKFEAIGIKPTTLDLFEELDEEKIKRKILGFIIEGKGGSRSYEEIEDWAYIYTSGVSKSIKIALLELEKEGKVKIDRLAKQKSTTVTEGAKIKHLKS